MGNGYGNVAPYGDKLYKQDIAAGDVRHFKAMLELWPKEQLVEFQDGAPTILQAF